MYLILSEGTGYYLWKKSSPRTPINWNSFPRPRYVISFEKALNKNDVLGTKEISLVLVFPGKAQRRKSRGDPNPSCSVTREQLETHQEELTHPWCDGLLMSV